MSGPRLVPDHGGRLSGTRTARFVLVAGPVLALASVAATAGCSSDATATEAPDAQPDVSAPSPALSLGEGELDPAAAGGSAPAPDGSAPATDGSAPAAPDSAAGGASEEAATEAGTDSATTAPPTEVSADLRATLIEFGERYLEYDYRVPHEERVEGLRDLTSAELFAELAEPMPPALVESLVEEERVVEAELTELQPLEAGVFQLSFTVTVSTAASASTGGSGDSGTTPDTRVLVVSVGPDDRVSDVR